MSARAPITTAGSTAPDFVGAGTGVPEFVGGSGVKASSGRVVVAVRILTCPVPIGGTILIT